MDLLNGKIKPLYFKYLSAAFGSALISSIYGMVDMAMVGQYQGPDGTAALIVSVARGLLISGILILLLPVLTGPDPLWLAMPVTELLTAVYTVFAIRRYTKAL